MQYLYNLANASLTLRVVEYFSRNDFSADVEYITVINQFHGWIINVKMKSFVSVQKHKDIEAFLSEMGIIYLPSEVISKVLSSLEAGQSAINVMERYQVAIVSHGRPQPDEIEVFRQSYIRGLGYCPQNLA
ncbi:MULTISPECIES: hypothetical protein [unclassified Nostoc]|uniref:hypothetical protein n=1 Tax=unclassified Nostoc TaxID=2593658 RepID=UPI002AD3614E|nr:hypothetical protein [Nostoc sp. DedQUE03]MDZ7974083.1 hypothetical protein [Nostoc sp. DedQUE03]MDZ8042989.1 hypothetical protein [Nostoc sp. DedQUE02]